VAYNFIPCDRDQSFLMPPSLSDWLPEDHLAWFILDACSQKERLEEDAQTRAAEQQKKIDERAAKEAATGVKLRGRKLKEPDPTPSKEARANPTDPESRILKNRKGYVQGYPEGPHLRRIGPAGNAQAAVTEEQIIVAAEVTQEENDVGQLHSTIAKTAENLARAEVEEKAGTALADAGYWSEANAEADDDGPDLLIATTKDWQQRKVARERPPPRGRIPKDTSCRARMERKLMTKRGRATYKKRSQTVEPVFPKGRALRGGQIKDARGCKRFNLRGLDGASGEWKLICGTHNLLKLWRHVCRQAGSGRANRN
jgi:hypothetical protein